MKARNRPPRLDPVERTVPHASAPEPALEQLLVRAHVAGRGTVGPTELRHVVGRLTAPVPGVRGGHREPSASTAEAWAAVRAVFGAARDRAEIDPARTVDAARRAGARLCEVARSGGRIAFATAVPAALLPLHAWLAAKAREAGGAVADGDDIGPLRIDGRTPRWIRFVYGVAVVTDGQALLGAHGRDAPDEWLFRLDRLTLAVADGWFAETALDAGVETVAFVGLERAALAVAAAGGPRRTVVPVHPARPPGAYDLLRGPLAAGLRTRVPPEM